MVSVKIITFSLLYSTIFLVSLALNLLIIFYSALCFSLISLIQSLMILPPYNPSFHARGSRAGSLLITAKIIALTSPRVILLWFPSPPLLILYTVALLIQTSAGRFYPLIILPFIQYTFLRISNIQGRDKKMNRAHSWFQTGKTLIGWHTEEPMA